MSIININKRVEDYVSKGYWSNETYGERLAESIEKYPNKIAVTDVHRQITYAEMGEMITNLINGLNALGISSNDYVAFQLPNWIEGHVVHNALRVMGSVIVPIITIYREKEVEFILNETKAKAIIIPTTYRKFDYVNMLQKLKKRIPSLEHMIVVGDEAPDGMYTFDQVLEMGVKSKQRKNILSYKVNPNDVCMVMYTSGTTSNPKGVKHTTNTLLREYRMFMKTFNLSSDIAVFMPSPITHISGLSALELPMVLGGKVSYLDIWDAEKAARIISEQKSNFMVSATTFLQWLVESDVSEKYDLSSMKNFVCGGAYIPPELIIKAPTAGIKVIRTYGSTECPTVSLGRPNDDVNITANTDGKIVEGYEVKIVDFEGNEVGVNKEGEIAVRGPEVFIGYQDEQVTKESFDEEGYFYTGDLGIVDEQGYLTITGRKKDIIIRGGENISTKEVEDLLSEHDAIEQVAIVAMPDPVMGEKACAFVKVATNQTLDFEEMTQYLLSKNIAKQKLPERLEIVDEMPTTPTGKILKVELRRIIAEKLGVTPIRVK